MALSHKLRKAIRDSGKSANELAREIGIPQPTISVFLNGGDIRLEKTADKLAAYFGVDLRPTDALKAKDKVKAPAPPAVDWTKTEAKKKPRDEGRERRR